MAMRTDHVTPLTPAQLEREKVREAERKKFDPGYVTAEEAAALPDAAREDPAVVARVSASARDWPENRASLAMAFPRDRMPTGDGGETRTERVDASAPGFFRDDFREGREE